MVEPEFSTISEADAAFYGDDSDGGDSNGGDSNGGDGGTGNWAEFTEGDTLGNGWYLGYQDHATDDKRRWFVVRTNPDNGDFEALTGQGTTYTIKSNDQWGEVPHHSLREDAVAAYNKWADANGEETVNDGGGEDGWTEWQPLRNAGDWWVWARTATDADKAQFNLSTTRNGQTVFLAPDGTIQTEMHVYDSVDALTAALETYRQRVEDGEVENRPTGDKPTRESIKKASEKVHTSATKMVEKLGGKKALVAAMGVAGLAVLSQASGGSN